MQGERETLEFTGGREGDERGAAARLGARAERRQRVRGGGETWGDNPGIWASWGDLVEYPGGGNMCERGTGGTGGLGGPGWTRG